ncbi:MAG: hypothetical protein Q8M03_06490 [Legionella sp.]|nr:hypothetical protein [Legionella sp.]
MFRQSIVYLLLSILVVIFAKYIHVIIVYIDLFYSYINLHLSPIFNQGGIGSIISKVLLLVLIPILIAAIPALVYRLIKGKNMPYFIELTWCLWLVIILSNVLIH